MNKINEALVKHGCKLSDLSDGLKAQVMELQETIKKYDAALDVYESSGEKDADADAQLEAMEKYIDENEDVLSNSIDAELTEKARVEKEAAATPPATEEKKEEAAATPPATEEKKEEAAAMPPATEEKKTESSTFMWVVGGIAAAIGLGFLIKNKG